MKTLEDAGGQVIAKQVRAFPELWRVVSFQGSRNIA